MLRWVGHVARMGRQEIRSEFLRRKFFSEPINLKSEKAIGNVKVNVKALGCAIDGTEEARDGVQWRTVIRRC
jgi:hypothetical protein